MRGLFPSKAWAHVRLMALFSVELKTAIGFSGAWGSCLYINIFVCVCVCMREGQSDTESDKSGSK